MTTLKGVSSDQQFAFILKLGKSPHESTMGGLTKLRLLRSIFKKSHWITSSFPFSLSPKDFKCGINFFVAFKCNHCGTRF